MFEKINKWNYIVSEALPPVKGAIKVFGYDWAGRTFGIYSETNTVLLLDPSTGDAFETDLDFYDFHNLPIPKNDEFCLVPEQFEEWYKANNAYLLKNNECVGYKIPLFLNGEDDISNLEISDMEVYWGIMSQLIN